MSQDITEDTTPKPLLDQELRDRYMARVIEHGKGRRRNFGRDFKDDDYLVGAMVAFEIFGSLGELPAEWIFGMMGNNSPITGPTEARVVQCGYGRCKQTATLYDERRDVPEEWVGVVLASWGSGQPSPIAFCSVDHARRHLAILED